MKKVAVIAVGFDPTDQPSNEQFVGKAFNELGYIPFVSRWIEQDEWNGMHSKTKAEVLTQAQQYGPRENGVMLIDSDLNITPAIKAKPQSLLEGLDREAQMPILPVVFVCMSHQLTPEQEQDLHQSFGVMTYELATHEDGTQEQVTARRVRIVLVSPELKKLTSQLPATYTLAEVQEVAKSIVAEAVACGASYFVCMGEPTLAMWANLYASNITQKYYEAGKRAGEGSWHKDMKMDMTCLASTTARTSVDEVQADGSVKTTAVFKHVQWRSMF